MTPTPTEHANMKMQDQGDDSLREKVVISGMAGLFPEAHSVTELSDILYNKKNPISRETVRWQFNHPEVAEFTGNIPELGRFDAQFFKVHYHLAQNMDAMARKVLEQAYQAIYDAGLSPEYFNGKKIGVFSGSCFSETEKLAFYMQHSKGGFGITGCSKTMFANRISYWLNAKGPSLGIDQACCSSTEALQLGYMAISSGDCEAAIVAGCNLCLHPQSSIHYGRIIKLCMDGKTKSFDKNASGCSRSEAINVLLLQKARDALRVYAEIIDVKCEFTSLLKDESGPRYGFYRDTDTTAKFIKKIYEENNVPPEAVQYVEAFGSAVPQVDKMELDAFDKVFCKNRKSQLLVGSVMSNIGYGEAASGISAITKVLLAYHTGQIAANLNCESPRTDVSAIKDKRIQIVTEHEMFDRTYAAVNGLSVTGVNTHVLLQGHYKPKDLKRYMSKIPHLVLISARKESGVKNIFNDLMQRTLDPEELALLQNIHQTRISGHLGRGYTILDTNANSKTVSLCENVNYVDQTKPQLCFVYSGMGSQWAGMGTSLMDVPVFAAAIERCHRVLHPKGIDIVHIITSPDPTTFDNILNSFLGIAAIQIGLTDVLRDLGLVPDKIIGHSVGELGCGYADGCLTAEEMILAAYSRGLVSLETPLICGSMAAVGVGYKEISKLCPPEIDVACHNGRESSTISGPADKMKQFVAELKNKNIFAKEVPCSNIAYHSRYIAEAGPGLLKYLKDVIKTPQLRSDRWISTSVPMEKWKSTDAKYCSPEYHTNNLLNPVLFEEMTKLIPTDAVIVEVAPTGLLQAILKRSLPDTCRNIPLTSRRHTNNAVFLLQAIGKLYMEGFYPKIQALYPKIEFPVSTGTPLLSHLVEWAHDENWKITLYASAIRKSAAACTFIISIHDDDQRFLQGHIIQGKNVYPHAATLVLVWDTLAMSMGIPCKELSVHFCDVTLHTEPILHDRRQLRLHVALHRGTGEFEVLDDESKVMTGIITEKKSNTETFLDGDLQKKNNLENINELNSDDIYAILYQKDYSYEYDFRSIIKSNGAVTEALLRWKGNWVTLIDGMMQLNYLQSSHDYISKPSFIRNIYIDPKKHPNTEIVQMNDETLLKATVSLEDHYTRCGGITIHDMKLRNLASFRKTKSLTTLEFVMHDQLTNTVDGTWPAEYYKSLDDRSYDTKTLTLRSSNVQDVNSMNWIESMHSNESGIPVRVHFAGVNSMDARRAYGIIAPDESNIKADGPCYGLDFSGITDNGCRVMGIAREAMRTRLSVRPDRLWPVPTHWTLEDAATVPLPYCMALYCLVIKCELQPSMRVLVHGGAGALGQAAISVALGLGCTVFTTVSDTRKKMFLLKLFPNLKAEHIGNSRDISFGDLVLTETKGEGCNVILCCLNSELKNTSIHCNRHGGIFLDITYKQNREHYNFGMYNLTKERSYASIDFSSVFSEENEADFKKLNQLMRVGIARGHVRPLSRVTYNPHQVSRAFRLVAASRHRGRVLIDMQNVSYMKGEGRLHITPLGCHVVMADTESFGFVLIDKLIECGARKFHFLLPTFSKCLEYKMRSWRKLGIEVTNEIMNELNKISALLYDSSKLGCVEGIFMTFADDNNNSTTEELSSFVKNMDALSRKMCPSLKHFVVVSNDVVGEETCMLRHKDRLPATTITLSKLSDNNENNVNFKNVASPCDVFDGVAKAICSNKPVVRICILPGPKILQRLAIIADISIPPDAPDNITLKQLGLDSSKIPAISELIRDVCHINISDERILSLTKQNIHEFEQLGTTEHGEGIGLEKFFSFVDSDELLATTEMVFMPTLFNNATLRDDEFDVNQTSLCIIPGMEGHHARFTTLCERLKLPALVLQPGLDGANETIPELSHRLTEHLMKKGLLKQEFYLLGYESGILVALKMASILENQGFTNGTVFCLGGTPDDFQLELENQLSAYKTDEEIQMAVLRHMYYLMTGEHTSTLHEVLEQTGSWREKVEVCVRTLLGRVAHSAQYARDLIETAYMRITQMRRYDLSLKPISSRIVLLRSASCLSNPNMLQQFSREPIIVHDIQGPLSRAMQDLRCSTIINRYLSKHVLEDFYNRNLCDSYLLNGTHYFMLSE